MAKYAADEKLSVPDRIRQVSLRLQLLLPSFSIMRPASKCCRYDVDFLVEVWKKVRLLNWEINGLRVDLAECFAAGYLDLSRFDRSLKPLPCWPKGGTRVYSYHSAAARWCRIKTIRLLQILDPENAHDQEDSVHRAAAQWKHCDRRRLEEWASDIKTSDIEEFALPLLAMERIHTLLVWERVPAPGASDFERRSTVRDVQEVRPKSLGYRCKRCGDAAIVASSGSKRGRKRYLKCPGCGWTGAAAKEVL